MKIESSKDYPGWHALLPETKREAVLRLARPLGVLGTVKLAVGLLWQGPTFRGIAVKSISELHNIQAKSRRPFPEITAYLGALNMEQGEVEMDLADVVTQPLPFEKAMSPVTDTADGRHLQLVPPSEQAKSA